jgi:hypothetical protein
MQGVADIVVREVNRFDSLPFDITLRLEKPGRRDIEPSLAMEG